MSFNDRIDLQFRIGFTDVSGCPEKRKSSVLTACVHYTGPAKYNATSVHAECDMVRSKFSHMHMCSHLRFSYVVFADWPICGRFQQTHQQAGTDGFLQMKEIIVYSKGEVDDDICSLTCGRTAPGWDPLVRQYTI